ncbi:hypothetical protein ABVT39_015187 [Epinephelus coioides]
MQTHWSRCAYEEEECWYCQYVEKQIATALVVAALRDPAADNNNTPPDSSSGGPQASPTAHDHSFKTIDPQYQMGAPIEPMGVDILGPFPMTDQESRYVLVAMDYFTKWPEAYAAPDQSATTTAEHLVKEMFCHFSVPEE